MNGGLPERLDPREAARIGLAGTGTVALSGLVRLGAGLTHRRGHAQVALAARVDRAGWCVLEGRASATVEAQCQRCLEPMPVPLEAPFVLAVVEDDAQAERLPAAYEPLCVAQGGAVALASLVEDELLLVMPAYVRHPEGMCMAAGAPAGTGAERGARHRPFAALGALRRP